MPKVNKRKLYSRGLSLTSGLSRGLKAQTILNPVDSLGSTYELHPNVTKSKIKGIPACPNNIYGIVTAESMLERRDFPIQLYVNLIA